MDNTIIEVKNLTYYYNSKHCALDNISFSVQQGDFFSIIGSNGSGKSTLLNLMCALFFAQQGELLYKKECITEKKLTDKSFNSYFRSSIGYVFQNSDSQLFCPTVIDELLFGPLQIGLNKDEAYSRAHDILKLLNIEHLENRSTHMLSGGEKKRVAIASVLTMNPEILLFDEPMSGLDPKTRSHLIEILFHLHKAGKTIIIATHHLELVNHFQSRVAVLSEQHRLEKIGETDEILNDTDLLIRTNLISEYPHRHGNTMHKHIPTDIFYHKHS